MVAKMARAAALLAPETAVALGEKYGKAIGEVGGVGEIEVRGLEAALLAGSRNSGSVKAWKLPDVKGLRRTEGGDIAGGEHVAKVGGLW